MLHSLVALASTALAFWTGDDAPPPPQPPSPPRPTVLVVVGVPGNPEYNAIHTTAARRWHEAATRAGAEFLSVGESPNSSPANPTTTDHDRLRDLLAQPGTNAAKEAPGPLWLVLLGHGSFDGREAKFNLRGPDLTDSELAQWLKPITRPVAVLDCTSSSAPFLTKLAGSNRIVVTATKSGAEQNYARFGQYLAEVWTDSGTDLDKDGQTSLLEGFLIAARRTNEFYKTKARLSTEHALIDDNSDGRGTPSDWFEGVRLTRKPKDGVAPDGQRAHQLHLVRDDRDRSTTAEQLAKRNELETQAANLQDRKSTLDETEYYRQFEDLMTALARTYEVSPSESAMSNSPKP